MRLVLKDYLLQLKEKDELDWLLCDLLLQMGYITENRPETGNRQYGVDIRAHNRTEMLLCVVKQGNIKRNNWDSGENAVRQSLNEIKDSYLNLLSSNDQRKKLHIIVVSNGVIDEAVRPNWEGYVKQNILWNGIKVNIEFWGIDELVNYTEKYLFDEHMFDFEMQGLLRKALYFIGEGAYHNKYFEDIIDKNIAQFSIKDSPRVWKKKIAGLYLASQMISQYAENEGIYKIAIQVSEYLLIRYWRYLLENSFFENKKYIDWLCRFLSSYEKWNEKYYKTVKNSCEIEGGFPVYNPIEQGVMLYEVLGYLITYAYYLTFKGEYDKGAKQKQQNLHRTIIQLVNNCPWFPYAPYDMHIGVVSMLYRFLIRVGRKEDVSVLMENQCKILAYYFMWYHKYPTAEDSFEDAVNIYMGVKAADYVTSAFWGRMLEWIVLCDEEDLYKQIQPFLKESLENVTKCTWYIKVEEELQFYDKYAMNLSGDGVAFDVKDLFEELKDEITFIMKQYEKQKFSFEEYSFEALEFIVCRYYGYLPRVIMK